MRIDDDAIVIGGDDVDEMEKLVRGKKNADTKQPKKKPEQKPQQPAKEPDATYIVIGGDTEDEDESEAPAADEQELTEAEQPEEVNAAEEADEVEATEEADEAEVAEEADEAEVTEEAEEADEAEKVEEADTAEEAETAEATEEADEEPQQQPRSAAVVQPRDMAAARAEKAAASIVLDDASSGTGEVDFRKEFLVTASPHIHKGEYTSTIMQDVLIALLPAAITSVIYFGWRSAMLIAVCVISCVLTEYVCRRIMKRRQTIGDYSAAVTGVLLAFCLPPELNPLYAVIGSVVAIAVVKQMFGGIGMNFANPAATARIVLMLSFPVAMTKYSRPFFYYLDASSGATPLAVINGSAEGARPDLLSLFIGYHSGCLGETCAVFLLLGGCYLLLRRVISWHIPVSFMGTVALIALIAGQNPLEHVLTGGVVLGAVFMATDYVTSPINKKGQIIYGIGCGLFTMMIRLFGSMTEGVSFAILLMNILTPHIERLTMPKPFGEERDAA